MKVVRTLLWMLLAVALVLFAVANWLPVEVRIGGGLVLETKLPLLVIGAFLAGLAPTWAIHRIARWRLERRVAALESGGADAAAGRADDADEAATARAAALAR